MGSDVAFVDRAADEDGSNLRVYIDPRGPARRDSTESRPYASGIAFTIEMESRVIHSATISPECSELVG